MVLSEGQAILIDRLQVTYPSQYQSILANLKLDQIEIRHTDIDLILHQFKRVIKCGDNLKDWITQYSEEIKSMFGVEIEDLTIQQFEKLIFKHPEINYDFIKNSFKQYNWDLPIYYNSEFEYGYQTSQYCQDNKMYYLKFYDLLLIDHDHKDGINKIREFCESHPSFLFEIWETTKGYHFHLLSHAIPYYSDQAKELMSFLGCDIWYVLYAERYGYKYRLSKKIREGGEEPYVAKFLETVGMGRPHQKCQRLNEIYQKYLQSDQYPIINAGFYDHFIQNIMWQTKQLKTLPEGVQSSIISSIRKPQMLIEGGSDYYIALDQKTHTYYICYQNLMVIDLDHAKISETVKCERDQEKFDPFIFCGDTFPEQKKVSIEIYQSLHGYHFFLTDQARSFDQLSNVQWTVDRGCDFYYALFSYLRGYCVRLNKKQYREELDPIYKYCGHYGDKKLQNQHLFELTQLHYDWMLKLKNEKPCLMR